MTGVRPAGEFNCAETANNFNCELWPDMYKGKDVDDISVHPGWLNTK